jgi:hypothetical protein
VIEDGLLVLLGLIGLHLFREAWWRETGEWPGRRPVTLQVTYPCERGTMSNVSLYIPIIVAAITGAVALLALAINAILTAYRERVNRRREMFSKAFAAAVAYEEFPMWSGGGG